MTFLAFFLVFLLLERGLGSHFDGWKGVEQAGRGGNGRVRSCSNGLHGAQRDREGCKGLGKRLERDGEG